ncbi:hypothetical protein ABZS66_00075 [Dactylosporangium sp. NPDC005572]|uniref:hypothetical protein n=1 Tax=Dactylosporangium sp. NPDC005572 TaxID=3156889 RepID=UPI0033AC9C09
MSTRPAQITTTYGWAEALDGIRATRAAITDIRAWITARIEHYQDLRDSDQPAEAGTELEKGANAMTDDTTTSSANTEAANTEAADTDAADDEEQRRRDDIAVEDQERQQHDVHADGVHDGDYDPEPGDGGRADLELEEG